MKIKKKNHFLLNKISHQFLVTSHCFAMINNLDFQYFFIYFLIIHDCSIILETR
jgi:hypothetical protein